MERNRPNGGALNEPLLGGELEHQGVKVTKYENANWFSRITFAWMTPLLAHGAAKTIDVEDVPVLARRHRATVLYDRFISNWPEKEIPHSTLRTLFTTFRKPFIITGLLYILKLSVTYAGPLLINSFVDFTAGKVLFPYEGYVLVAILITAKAIETTSTHMYQFTCNKLGMQVRSALISTIYRKGLRLSSSARQSHGVGSIVNYMSVDVQQLSDACVQLHNLWFVPSQLVLAIVILWSIVGPATMAGLAVMIVTALSNVGIAKYQKNFQTGIMAGRDRRIKVFNESLNNMKVIKLQGWEGQFLKNVENARAKEYGYLWRYMYLTAFSIFVVWFTPLAACVAIFGTSAFIGGGLSPGLAFTVIATVRITQEPLRLFPQALVQISQAWVSIQRLDKYMWSNELEKGAVEELPFSHETPAVTVTGASFKWEPNAEVHTLTDINLNAQRGSLITVVGRVGSGKSSLLAAIMGEMQKICGKVEVSGTTAYVAQSSWIQNGTIEENILFGGKMNRTKYQDVIQRCALETDLAQMDQGDQTEIGERGINLSGGQKQRIQLARALYQDCDIYLLDDIFSAVDAHTGSHIFQKCILEGLAGKTVILVTHQVEFLHGANLILVMRNGSIVQQGRFDELLEAGLDFESLVEAHNESLGKVNPTEKVPEVEDVEPLLLNSISASSHLERLPSSRNYRSNSSRKNPEIGRSPSTANGANADGNTPEANKSLKLIEEEERSTGSVGLAVYWLYLTTAYGGALALLILIIQIIWQGLLLAGDYWVAYETGTNAKYFDPKRFIFVYGTLAVLCALCVFGRALLIAIMSLMTSQDFYLRMLRSLFRAPMSFFDTTPSARILSRASTDQASIDILIPLILGSTLAVAFTSIGILVVVVQVTWQILALIAPLAYVYYRYQAYFIKSSRELTRLDAVTKAPVIHHFDETVAGFITIRCFKQERRFVEKNIECVNSNLRMDFHNSGANEWIGFRLEMIGTVVLCASALLLVSLPASYIKPESVGLSLSYGLLLNNVLFITVYLLCLLENKMVAVERVSHYIDLPTEAPLYVENRRPASNWPTKGTIVLENIKLRYRPSTPLVLNGISVTFKGGSKVGVVGRTGSGKSTLVLALFRLVELSGGRISIDGVDISSIGLNDLRTRLSIIPQEPTLFDGTIRTNLDPTSQYSDEEIWEALRKCQLSDIVKLLPLRLESPVLENGENYSVGQRQLFCLGRALLKQSRILVLDEATASVDTETDTMIQNTVRKEFANCTVLSIAHRIPTVMDCDKVLVLDKGKMKEYDSPAKLMEVQPESIFAALVHEYQARSQSNAETREIK